MYWLAIEGRRSHFCQIVGWFRSRNSQRLLVCHGRLRQFACAALMHVYSSGRCMLYRCKSTSWFSWVRDWSVTDVNFDLISVIIFVFFLGTAWRNVSPVTMVLVWLYFKQLPQILFDGRATNVHVWLVWCVMYIYLGPRVRKENSFALVALSVNGFPQHCIATVRSRDNERAKGLPGDFGQYWQRYYGSALYLQRRIVARRYLISLRWRIKWSS